MYWSVQSAITTWRNQTIQAIQIGDGPTYQPHWWDCEPLVSKPEFAFTINPNAPLVDNYFTGTINDIFSRRLIDLLHSADIEFETFPVTLFSRRTGEALDLGYTAFHLLTKYPLSMIRARNMEGKVVSIEVPMPLFRVEKYQSLMIMHDKLKNVMDETGITGFHYRPFR